jgi:hypothetical protein
VVDAMREALDAWHAYRDGVARLCGFERAPDGSPRLAA